MSRRLLALSLERSGKPALVAGGILALALVAGCGSSGGGGTVGSLSTPTPSASATPTPTPTETGFPGPSASPTGFPGPTSSLRDFTDSASGISLQVPEGYVIATTAAEAAARFPAVFGGDVLTKSKITDAQDRLNKNTILVAFHPPINGQFDNIGIARTPLDSTVDPSEVQGSSFATTITKSLTTAGASIVRIKPVTIDSVPAAQVSYRIKETGQSPVYGQQIYLVRKNAVYITTVTAGTSARAATATTYLTDHWSFS